MIDRRRDARATGYGVYVQSRFVLDPNSRNRLLFEIFMALVCVHDAVVIPARMAWPSADTSFRNELNLCILFCWLVDTVSNFFTGYYKETVSVDWKVIMGGSCCLNPVTGETVWRQRYKDEDGHTMWNPPTPPPMEKEVWTSVAKKATGIHPVSHTKWGSNNGQD